jgi:biotin transport system substrate-specific component
MFKRLWKKIRYFRCLDNYPEFNLGSTLVVVFCVFLIVISTFTQIPFPKFFTPERYSYIPQIPAVLFIAALMGPRLGLLSVALYIVIGLLGFPVFASGGGIKYCTQMVFGYILGYFIGVYLVGKILSTKFTNLSIFRSAVVGVVAIHLVGISYLIIVMLFTHDSLLSILSWINTLSVKQILYDLAMSYVAICLARPVRTLLWIAMD